MPNCEYNISIQTSHYVAVTSYKQTKCPAGVIGRKVMSMKNAYLDMVNDKIQAGEDVNAGARDLCGAYIRSVDKGFEVILFDSLLREARLAGMVEAMKAAGVNELYYAEGWSNQIELFLMLDDLGLKLRGVVRLENAQRRMELDRWGCSDQPETIAALQFKLKEG